MPLLLSQSLFAACFKVVKIDNLLLTEQVHSMSVTATGAVSSPVTPEQMLIDEFSGIFRRQLRHNSDPSALIELVGKAFAQSIGGDTRVDRLARARMRGLEVRQELATAEGGSFSSEEVARLLGISKTAVLKRYTSGRLLGWRVERLQAVRFPQWQFDARGQVLSGLEEVLKILNQNARLDAWGKVLFFLQKRIQPGELRPLDLLRKGQLTAVCPAAQAYAE